MSRTRTPPGSVAFVGAGPADPGLLTVHGRDLLERADVVVTDASVGADVLALCRPDAEVVRTGTAEGELPAADVAKAVVTAARAGQTVVRLVAGDPFLFGTAAEEAEACSKAKLRFEVVPGVPHGLAAATYAGVPLAPRSRVRDMHAVDVRPGSGEPDWSSLAAGSGTLVLLASAETLGKAATKLVEAGRAGDTPVALTRGGTSPSQRTIVSTLDRIEADAAAAGMSDATSADGGVVVAVIGDVVRLRERLSWFESRPLFGWTVLVPRTRAQAGSLSAELRALGATPVEVPTIAVEPPRTPAPMERAIRGLVSGRYAWVAFTSTNAVRAVREKLEEVGLDARAFAGVKIAAVGEATASSLQEFGIRPDLVPAGEQSSEGLLDDWAPYDDVLDPLDRVFLPRADIATETLVAGLKERGWAVDDVTAYRTVRASPPPASTREALKGGGFDAVLFTSSSTVRNLVGIAGKPHESTVLAAIGPQTASTARELGLRVDVMSPSPSVSALVDALAAFAVQRRDAAAKSSGTAVEPVAERAPRPRNRSRKATSAPGPV